MSKFNPYTAHKEYIRSSKIVETCGQDWVRYTNDGIDYELLSRISSCFLCV